MSRDIDDRYYAIKVAIKELFSRRLTGSERVGNSTKWYFLCHDDGDMPTLYKVNAGEFIYDLTPPLIDELLAEIKKILDGVLLEGGDLNFWAMDYVEAEFRRGTHSAFINLSHQSDIYSSQTTLQMLLSSPGYLNQVATARVTTISEWQGVSDSARADLVSVVTDAIARGVNPAETAKVVSKRLDVSKSKAKAIAQTEQVGALRKAQRHEVDWARERLGLNTAVLWMSALKPVTRAWHGSRHGRTYTTEEVEAFYSERGNKFHCYCANIPCLLDDEGRLFNRGLAEKLAKERRLWEAKEFE